MTSCIEIRKPLPRDTQAAEETRVSSSWKRAEKGNIAPRDEESLTEHLVLSFKLLLAQICSDSSRLCSTSVMGFSQQQCLMDFEWFSRKKIEMY